jgi:hypothetical protein
MKKTLQTQYLLIQEGKGHKGVFLADAKRQFPQYVPNAATYEEAIASLKTKSIINENFVGLEPIVGYEPKKKESFETAFESFLAEARKKKDEDEKVKAEEKKVSKPVEEDLSHNYDKTDEKNPDNLVFDQIMMGYYAELKDPKNADKTMQQLKDIVLKNLAKDPIHYTKDGQFGVKDLGYTTEAPGLGEPKEPKGKYASSGYGNLNESQEERDEIKKSLKKQVTEPSSTEKSTPEEIEASLKKSREKELERRKEAGELEESKIREVIREMINAEINEIFGAIGAFQAGTLSGRGGDSMDVTRKRTSYDEPRRDDEVKRPTIHDVVIDLYGEEFSGLSDPKLTQQQKDSAWAEYKRIHGELEEAYQLVNIRPQVSDKERQERDPQEFTTIYLDSSVEELMKKNQHLRVLRNPQNPEEVTGIAIRARLLEPRNMKAIGYDINPMFLNYLNNSNNIGGKIELPARDASKRSGMDEYFVLNNASVGRSGKLSFKLPNPKFQKPMMENLSEGVEKDLAAINKEAEHEVLQSKLDKIDALIDSRKSKLNKLDEDEDMKALTDKKKVKELEKDIKTLEKAKAKIEKMLAKKAKNAPKTKEVIDEDEPISEVASEDAETTSTAAGKAADELERAAKAAEDLDAALEENEMASDAPEGYLMAKDDAEKRMDAGEELDSILSDYPEYRDTLELDMMGKYDGMDY